MRAETMTLLRCPRPRRKRSKKRPTEASFSPLRPYMDRGKPGLRYDGEELPRVREPEVPKRKPLTASQLRNRAEPELADADAALEHWAAWAKSALSAVGWPEKTLLARVIEYGVLGAAQRGGGTPVVGMVVEYDELCAWVEEAVMRLAIDEHRIITYVYLGNMPPEIAAKELGISRGTFDSRLSRARRSVRDYLDGRKASLALQEKAM